MVEEVGEWKRKRAGREKLADTVGCVDVAPKK